MKVLLFSTSLLRKSSFTLYGLIQNKFSLAFFPRRSSCSLLNSQFRLSISWIIVLGSPVLGSPLCRAGPASLAAKGVIGAERGTSLVPPFGGPECCGHHAPCFWSSVWGGPSAGSNSFEELHLFRLRWANTLPVERGAFWIFSSLFSWQVPLPWEI